MKFTTKMVLLLVVGLIVGGLLNPRFSLTQTQTMQESSDVQKLWKKVRELEKRIEKLESYHKPSFSKPEKKRGG